MKLLPMKKMEDYPFIRQVKSPINTEELRPLDPRCRVVQFCDPLTETDFTKLSVFMQKHPEIPLRIYGHYGQKCNLDFLTHFQFLRGFVVDCFELEDIAGLQYLPDNLEYFWFGDTKSKRFSLEFLERFQSLKSLFLENQTKHIEVLSNLHSLESLTLRSITLPDLSILLPLKNLLSLDIKLGGTKDLSLLPRLGRLRYLELWMVKGLSNIASIAGSTTLQYLFLQALKNVSEVPALLNLAYLRRVHLETMKGVRDLTPIADAPALEELLILDMRHLQPEHFRPFVGHPTLKKVTAGLGSIRKNVAVERLLDLPAVGDVKGKFQFH